MRTQMEEQLSSAREKDVGLRKGLDVMPHMSWGWKPAYEKLLVHRLKVVEVKQGMVCVCVCAKVVGEEVPSTK